ncbi:Maf family protein [Roseovarius tibetensis]|uniref:Maf family protein n=1 Tax=Roseovarius tibetensis TaxID=2685897 RepID=UPI003D7F93A5
MMSTLVLASTSRIRHELLEKAGLSIEVTAPRVDEAMIRDAMLAEQFSPRDIADGLAEAKAMRVSRKRPGAMVLGCDQVLDLDGKVLSKPATPDEARAQLLSMRGRRHDLLSAAVICQDGEPIWRHVGRARLTVRQFSDDWIDTYIKRNWPDIAETVGAYKLEAEGVRLFSKIEGDYFTILGLPLLDLLSFLTLRGDLPT